MSPEIAISVENENIDSFVTVRLHCCCYNSHRECSVITAEWSNRMRRTTRAKEGRARLTGTFTRAMTTTSFLPIVADCDNFSYFDHQDELAVFCLSGSDASLKSPVGLLWPEVVSALRDDNQVALNEGKPPTWTFLESDGRTTHVYFSESYTDRASRSAILEATCLRWHKTGVFAEVVGGRQWRNELYAVFSDPFKFGGDPEDIVFTIERSAAALFGLVTYGVHMTVFQKPAPGRGGEILTWVPTRAKTKPT